MKRITFYAISLCMASLSLNVYAERILSNEPIVEFEAVVVGVIDGDTVDIYREGYDQARCRLASIDAPERSQAFGQRSKQLLSTYVFSRTVIVGVVDKENRTDRANRLICTLKVDGVDVNGAMILGGMAWYSRNYLRDPMYIDFEKHARTSGTGLWVDVNPTYHGEYRQAGWKR